MSKNDQLWLSEYIRTGDAIQAIKDVFPDCSEASAPSRASQLKQKMESEIDQALNTEIKRSSIIAFRIISNLMVNAKQESIKYKCASDILNRGGFTEVHKFVNVTKDESYQDLMKRLKTSLNSLDGTVLNEVLSNTKDIKGIQLLSMGQVGSEQ